MRRKNWIPKENKIDEQARTVEVEEERLDNIIVQLDKMIKQMKIMIKTLINFTKR